MFPTNIHRNIKKLYRGRILHDAAEDHNDTESVSGQGAGGGTLEQFPLRPKRGVVRDVNAAWDVTSTEAAHVRSRAIGMHLFK